MDTKTIVICLISLILGMLVANMLKNVCGCKVVEGQGCCLVNAPDSVGVENNILHDPNGILLSDFEINLPNHSHLDPNRTCDPGCTGICLGVVDNTEHCWTPETMNSSSNTSPSMGCCLDINTSGSLYVENNILHDPNDVVRNNFGINLSNGHPLDPRPCDPGCPGICLGAVDNTENCWTPETMNSSSNTSPSIPLPPPPRLSITQTTPTLSLNQPGQYQLRGGIPTLNENAGVPTITRIPGASQQSR